MKPILSILIPSLHDRYNYLTRILNQISSQPEHLLNQCEIQVNIDGRYKTTGEKRNQLLSASSADYIVFIDDDDSISPNYLEQIFIGISKNVDAIAITSLYSPDDIETCGSPRIVKHSKDYVWAETPEAYLRNITHICPVKRDLALQVGFPPTTFGEDISYSSGLTSLVKEEYLIEDVIYTHQYRSKK